MFLTKTYTYEDIPIPNIWIEYKGYSIIQNLLSKIKSYSHYTDTSHWLRHPQIDMGILPILYYLKENTTLFFEHTAKQYSQATLDRHIQDNTQLDIDLFHFTSWGEFPQTNQPGIQFIHIKKGRDIFKILDTHHTDQKHISLGLQEDRNHKIRVYNNLHPNTYTIVTSRYNWLLVRKIIALLPILFPDIHQLPEELKTLMRTFAGNNYELWLDYFNNWLISLNLKQKEIQTHLNYIVNLYKHRNIKQYTQNIASYQQTIRNYERTIEEAYQQLQQQMLALNALQNMKDNEATDLTDYILKHKYITNIEPATNGLYMCICSPIIYYDEDAFLHLYNNHNSAIHNYPQIAKLLGAIFKDNRFDIYFETGVHIDFYENKVIEHIHPLQNKAPKQPHLHEFKCWGNNKSYITKALNNKNYINCIEQIVAATQNFNWVDSPVVNHLINDLNGHKYDKYYMFKDLTTNKFMTFQETLNILKKENDANETNQNT